MKVCGDNAPPGAYSIEENPRNADKVFVRFFENAQEILDEPHWEYDEYQIEVPKRDNLAAEIEANYDVWLDTAKSVESPGPQNSELCDAIAALTLLGVQTDG